jgi:hypothetical protein
MIHECAPITNAFASVPPQMGPLNCAAYLAGMIAGILDCSRFVSGTHASFISLPAPYLTSNCHLSECEGNSPFGIKSRRYGSDCILDQVFERGMNILIVSEFTCYYAVRTGNESRTKARSLE